MEKIDLHTAVRSGNAETVRKLLEGKCDIEETNFYGDTALLAAVSHKHYEVVKVLLAANANLKATNRRGESLMHNAVGRYSTIELLELLYEHGADVNAINNDEEAPLQYAIGGHVPEVARWLLEHGAEVNAQDNLGFTALHTAVAMMPIYEDAGETSPFIALLQEFGADPNIPDKRGNRATDLPVRQTKSKSKSKKKK